MTRILIFLTVLSSIIITTGCSNNSIYRDTFNKECEYVKEGDCARNARQVANPHSDREYRLGFIEYDDQGQLRDPQQQGSVIDGYLDIASKEDVLMLVFVHGWHHNASPEGTNIQGFRKMLASVSESEARYARKQGRDRRTVLGAYIGWRGESVDIEYLNTVTFWDRKNTAHEVGHQGVSSALLKLEEMINVGNAMQHQPPPYSSRMVVIGHSFGGAVVFGSLQKIMLDRFIDSRRDKNYAGQAKGFGDMVVLMNPAFEAMRFTPLLELSQEKCRGYFQGQLPRLAILTSETDYATKHAFPAGRFFSTFFESHKTMARHECQGTGSANMKSVDISQGKADYSAVGHFEPYLTHRINPAKDKDTATFNLQQAYQDWSASDPSKADIFSSVTLENKGRTTARNPYMNIQVDEELMDGHNDIWRDEIAQFVRELITVSTTPEEVYQNLGQ